MARLYSLPTEVSVLILDQVQPRDWLSLRQTCKALKARTDHLVTDSFFRTRTVMIERTSLQCLESISKSESLSGLVQELDICISHLLPLDEIDEVEPPYSEYEGMMKDLEDKGRSSWALKNGIDYHKWYKRWRINNAETESCNEDSGDEDDSSDGGYTVNRSKKVNQRQYQQYLLDQADMAQTNFDIRCLTQALASLKNCKEISISTSIQAWGLRRMRRSIGILPQRGLTFQSKESIRKVHYIIQVILGAIAASKISVEVLIFEPKMMLENSNRISPFMLMGPSSESPLDDVVSGREWGPDLVRFLRLLPALSDLELEFGYRDEAGRFSEIAKELYIPKLERFSLLLSDTTKEDLAILLLRHHRTLRAVYLDAIQLVGDLTAWHWLLDISWRSLQLDKFHLTSCWAGDEEREYFGIDRKDISIVDEDSFTIAMQTVRSV
ncbi:hypothetical protein FAUST_11374 [Fusarium austroamericanum]|uniref:F-box domain-containing protein n=1 Tax=Fusarium austroamericanum TaxID=282268 RepID=A0AAN5YZI1_FUSAU|nr:hypothetical protein FAUST_11374 [Fusarium austroamericanum]